jgi:acetyl-CoA C-acetyltransferase
VTSGQHARLRGETEMGEAWIIDAVRTPRGKGRKDVGALVQTHPQELMATTLRALAARNALDPHDEWTTW